jgi:hypothetical protein
MTPQSQSLDQIVKGAPAPHTSVNAVTAAAHANPPPYSATLVDTSHDANDRISTLKHTRAPSIVDPTSLLPSSPPQIYLNLLILEASLRSQYLTLRARRRQNTFVLTLLVLYLVCFFDLIFLRPREDGKGRGGSQYWMVDMLQKVCFITGVVTVLLFWATGQWERGVRWPRRWIGVANRGLRGVNAKIVVIRGPWYTELFGWVLFLRPFSGGLWGGEQGGSSYHFINVSQEKSHGLDGGGGRPRHMMMQDGKEYAEEDIAPGGDYIKLLLLPKPFTPDFRDIAPNTGRRRTSAVPSFGKASALGSARLPEKKVAGSGGQDGVVGSARAASQAAQATSRRADNIMDTAVLPHTTDQEEEDQAYYKRNAEETQPTREARHAV